LENEIRAGFAWGREIAAYRVWKAHNGSRCDSGRLKVGDIEVFYMRYGTGEPVLLLHGGFFMAEDWVGQIPALSENHTVIAMDTRGHGRTTLGSKPLSYSQLSDDAAGVIEQMGLGPVHLVGWSDGGTAALGLALRRPDLLKSLVLLGTPFSTDNYGPEALRGIDDFLRPAPMLLVLLAIRWLVAPSPKRGSEFLAQMRRMWKEEPDFTLEELSRIEAPALVIACDRDEFLSPAGDPYHVFRALTDALPNGRMAPVPGGTHTVSIERPDTINRLLLEFIG
jgi:pimeloyl-ACP methyl ester carboxylesterase